MYVYFSKPRGCYIYMYVSSFLSIGAVVCIMLVWTLGVWGELACHKRSLMYTHTHTQLVESEEDAKKCLSDCGIQSSHQLNDKIESPETR